MMIRYWRPDSSCAAKIGNFGDELNPWLWPREIPGAFDSDAACAFFGIGTMLGYPKKNADAIPRKIVFGTGAAFAHAWRTEPLDASWKIYFVRGPLTANAIRIGEELAITDPAVLVGSYFERQRSCGQRVGFMPHVTQAISWELSFRRVCEALDVIYIDPRDPVETVVAQIASVGTVVSEAMHGAIVADALRVPWIPVYTGLRPPRFKWTDWCESVNVDYRPRRVCNPCHVLQRLGARGAYVKGLSETVLYQALKRVIRMNQRYLSSERRHRWLSRRVQDKVVELRDDVTAGRFVNPKNDVLKSPQRSISCTG